MDTTYDEAKFTEMVLYVAGKLRDDRAAGATKLNRVLYFADFAHTRRHGRPISGAEYERTERGSRPRRLAAIQGSLVDAGHAEWVLHDFLGHLTPRLIPQREADVHRFVEDELETIDRVLADLGGLIDGQVNELLRDEPGWKLTELGETIRYETAMIAKRQISTPTSRRLAEQVASRYGIAVGG